MLELTEISFLYSNYEVTVRSCGGGIEVTAAGECMVIPWEQIALGKGRHSRTLATKQIWEFATGETEMPRQSQFFLRQVVANFVVKNHENQD